MTIMEILLLLRAASETVQYLSGLATQLQREGRDPTPAELREVKARQEEAELAWQALLPRPPE